MDEEENYSLQTEPTWEHKALSGTGSILCARCKSILREAPEKGAYHQRRDSSKRIEPGTVRFLFLTASQTRFAQGELISGSAAI